MGATLSELQAWDQQGRKRGMAEQLTTILDAALNQRQQNQLQAQSNTLNEAKLRESGYEPQSGMTGLLSKIAGTGGYKYTGNIPQSSTDLAKAEYYKSAAEANKSRAGYYDRSTGAGGGNVKVVGKSIVKYDPVTGAAEPVYTAPNEKKLIQTDFGAFEYDPITGQTRPVVDQMGNIVKKYTKGQVIDHGGKKYRVLDDSDDPELEAL